LSFAPRPVRDEPSLYAERPPAPAARKEIVEWPELVWQAE
jgi:hypothetical protein